MLAELLIAFGIMAVTVVIHVSGMVMVLQWLIGKRDIYRTQQQQPGLFQTIYILIAVFGIITLLHVAEAIIWAGFYQAWGLFQDFETALYFSFTSYTTTGFGDVVLPQKWRLLGSIEGISGVLLSGLSTAFIFVIINALLQFRRQRRSRKNE